MCKTFEFIIYYYKYYAILAKYEKKNIKIKNTKKKLRILDASYLIVSIKVPNIFMAVSPIIALSINTLDNRH